MLRRQVAEALGPLAKTDTIDAAALAAHGTAGLDLPATPPRSPVMELLADLLVLRENHRGAGTRIHETGSFRIGHGGMRPLESDSRWLPIVCQIDRASAFCKRQRRQAIALASFSVVAGVGFEPTTFRL